MLTATDLVKTLRDEAQQVKQCFTQFSFQGLVFSSALLGLIVHFQVEQPATGCLSVLVILVLLSIGRIGIFKYSTANRNYGYELYLQRMRAAQDSGDKEPAVDMGWEEAMCAWRIVQATAFECLYGESRWWSLNRLRKRHRGKKERWFEPRTLVVRDRGASYYAGGYLRTMLNIIYFIVLVALVPLPILLCQLRKPQGLSPVWTMEATAVFAVFLCALLKICQLNCRRKILEEGLLSINSCAVMWEAVVIAHLRAQAASVNYQDYIQKLSEEAAKLRDRIFDIHAWMQEEPNVQNR